MNELAELIKPQTPDQYEKKRILETIEQIRKSPLVASINVIFEDELILMERALIGVDE